MKSTFFEIESKKNLSKSRIWQLNRDFYNFHGISAFCEDIVPLHLTSNAFFGKTYAELIFGLLKDIADKGKGQRNRIHPITRCWSWAFGLSYSYPP
jgi:hypothetical protein